MPSLKLVTKFLTPMKRKGEALSIKSLNAQINAMMQAICLIGDEDSRIQFMKRVEVVQRDLHCLRSELESYMPRNLKQPSTLNIDHSLHLIGNSEEGYISLTKKIWQNVLDIKQRIDRLSEGLAFVIQRHSRHLLQASRSSEDLNLHSQDYSGDSDSDIMQQTTSSRDTDELSGSNYSFEYSQSNSDGHQGQISLSHARQYYHLLSNSQANQHSQFARDPNYLNQHSTNMNPYDRFTTRSPSQVTRDHSHGYFTEFPSYFPQGRYSQNGVPSSKTPSLPRPSSSFWRIPSNVSNFGEFNNHSLTKYYPGEESSLRGYVQNSQRTVANRHN